MTEQPTERPRFRRREELVRAIESPEVLFGELPRTPDGVGALWSHQADQLREYMRDHVTTPDVALELPTGSGKTLVGLLLAEWRRRSLGQRVVYACPTKQLARQVARKATEQGIPVALLINARRTWDPAVVARYTRGDAVAVTVYSGIFNSNSPFSDAQTLLFDDAHAAEGFVAEAWAINIGSSDAAYGDLLDAFGDDIDRHFVARMVAADSPSADPSEVRLLPISAVARHADDIDRVLATLKGNSAYRYAMIRTNLSACLFYVARGGIYIRPMVPPTFEHGAYVDPTQRIYLSATLGAAGELERAFGRTGIQRVAVPPAWDRHGSGRRFFAFPDLVTESLPPTPAGDETSESEAEQPDVAAALLDLAPKRLILTPDDKSASAIADALGVPAAERFTAKDPDTGIEPFVAADKGTLLAANRYDGMDLADEACRMMLMAGLPRASHLQDRFLASKLRAGEVLLERVRTRVIQGAGRCTRGPKDRAVVVIKGDELVRFLSRGEIRRAMPVELQAEIEFGMYQSQVPARDLVLLAESALNYDEIWQEDAEPDLAQRRRDADRVAPADIDQLADSAQLEVTAWTSAWQQDWEGAVRAAVDVLERLTAPNLRSYRALWAYLGSAWSALAAEETGDAGAAQRAASLLETAHRAAAGTTWLKEVQPVAVHPGADEPVDLEAVDAVIATLRSTMRSQTKADATISRMLAGLTQTEAGPYEQGLAALGALLGSRSFKPAGPGRTDAAWLWPSCWATVEAKSEQVPAGALSMELVRKANTQLDSLAADEGADPPGGSFSVVVTPRAMVDPDAISIARPHLHLVAPDLILDVAHDAARAWNALRGATSGVQGDELRERVGTVLWQHRVLPTQVRERLTKDPIQAS